jgi:uncharacterized membrane protein
MLTAIHRNNSANLLKQFGWWVLFLVCVFYALYALYLGGEEILHQLGIVQEAKYRATPLIFIIHSLAGFSALITGPLQFNRAILTKRRNLHRLSGKIYVYAVWIASTAALVDAMFFDIPFLGKIAFGVLAVLWFGATTTAFLRIRKRNIREHREWMIRSFSLSFFFVTGGFWMPGLTSTSLPYEIAYPLAVFLAWFLNLVFAEAWIRWTRNGFTKTEPISIL